MFLSYFPTVSSAQKWEKCCCKEWHRRSEILFFCDRLQNQLCNCWSISSLFPACIVAGDKGLLKKI